jgi:hypothetical protein
MQSQDRSIFFHVTRVNKNGVVLRTYNGSYQSVVCVGEVIRNLCVNLCIDPDTVDGYTRNITVTQVDEHGHREVFRYQPSKRLDTCFQSPRTTLEIVCLDDHC